MRAKIARLFAVLWLLAACSKSGNPAPPPVDTERDAGANSGDAAIDGGTRSGDAGSARLDAGRTKVDAGRISAHDGGSVHDAGAAARDAGNPNLCAGVNCPSGTVCDRDASVPLCACPPGYDFSDVGGSSSPCVLHCDGDCDGG